MTALLGVKKIWLHFLTPEERVWRVSPSLLHHIHAQTHTQILPLWHISLGWSQDLKVFLSPNSWVSKETCICTLSGTKCSNHLIFGEKKLRPFSICIWCFKFIRFSNIRNPGRSQTPSLCTWRGWFALSDYKLTNYSQTLHWYYSFQSNKLTNDTTQVTKREIFKGFSFTCRVFSLVKIVLNLSIWSHSSFHQYQLSFIAILDLQILINKYFPSK